MNESSFFKTPYDVRGFGGLKFHDQCGCECRIQKSSAACFDAIWLGITCPDPKIMSSDAKKLGIDTKGESGWVTYPIPKEVLISTSMHLTQNQVRQLLPVLQYFAENGSLPSFEDADKMSSSVDLIEEDDLFS
jgi:hypothetical protein